MRLAHISDLHFGAFSLSPTQFFSKRWIGNFNFLFTRKKKFCYDRLLELITFFKEEGVTHVLITGDLSVTSRRVEFKMGDDFISLLKKEGLKVFVIPGNHDHYTRLSDRKKKFYKFFDAKFNPTCPLSLKEDKVTYTKLEEGLWLVGIDTATATGFNSCQGYFSPQAAESLETALKAIPSHDRVILFNHYPLFHNEEGKKGLIGSNLLKAILNKHPNVVLYLNGHTHRQTVADLRPSRLPIISDTGSTPHKENGNCHIFEFKDNALILETFLYEEGWKQNQGFSFSL